jgi:para-aminobenzoate synthetase
MDPLEAFREFYSSERRAVWLDSSSAKTTGRGSLDIMAAPTSEEDVIEYYLHSGKDILTKLEEQLFTGTGVPEDVIVVNDDFQSHQKVMDKNLTFPPFDYRGGYLGFLGYEVRHDTLRFLQKAEHGTSMVNLGVEKVPYESNVPAAAFFLARRSMVYHHPTQTWHLIGLIEQEYEIEETLKWMKTISGRLLSKEGGITPVTHKSSLTSNPLTFQPNRPKKSYEKDIARCHSFIEQGESYELCLTNQLETRVSQKLSTWDLYSILRLRNPAPYASYLKWNIDSSGSSNSPSPHFSICSSSPERFMSVKRKQRHPRKKIFLQAEAKPIKGTCARVTPKNGVCFSDSEKREDERRARFLQISQKNRAENLMIVDLLRNDISRVCQVGSVHVAKLMDIESFTTVHQMVSTIRGTLSSQKNCIDLLRASFPGGSMTGAPKIRTMELLEELEQSVERGPYAGSLGYISVNGCMDMNIIIRSAVVTSSNKEDGMKITIGAGGAITALSETEDEYDEMMLKARAVVDAVQEWATTGTPEVEPSEIASAIKNSSTNTSFDARQSFN